MAGGGGGALPTAQRATGDSSGASGRPCCPPLCAPRAAAAACQSLSRTQSSNRACRRRRNCPATDTHSPPPLPPQPELNDVGQRRGGWGPQRGRPGRAAALGRRRAAVARCVAVGPTARRPSPAVARLALVAEPRCRGEHLSRRHVTRVMDRSRQPRRAGHRVPGAAAPATFRGLLCWQCCSSHQQPWRRRQLPAADAAVQAAAGGRGGHSSAGADASDSICCCAGASCYWRRAGKRALQRGV